MPTKEEVKKVVVVEEIVDEGASKVEEKKEIKLDSETNLDSESISELTEKPNYLWIIIPTALLVGALVGGLITYFSGISKISQDNQAVATNEPTSSPTPTSTPEATIKRDTIKIQVLNGSGTSGLAGKAKTFLEDLGYVDVIVGNAVSSDFAETEIQIKDTKKELLEMVTKDLSKNYTLSKTTKTLVETSKYDVVVTLGKK